MQVLYECCCGLDVHKKTVVACVLITSPNGQVHKQVRTFATTTADLLRYCQILASFIPSKPTRDLRDVVRYRKILVQERAREINRLHKVLETANIK
jgi:transposase